MTIVQRDHTSLFDIGPTTEVRLAESEPVFHAGDPATQIALARKGRIHLPRRTASGTTIILRVAQAGETVAEAVACSPLYHCGAEAARASRVVLLPVARFRAAIAADPSFADALAARVETSFCPSAVTSYPTTRGTCAAKLSR